jgi:hypothetical protein
LLGEQVDSFFGGEIEIGRHEAELLERELFSADLFGFLRRP